MQEFAHIESLHILRKYVKDLNAVSPSVTSPVKYRGTVKIHGMNVGVHVVPGEALRGQSRTRVLEVGQDGSGFLRFLSTPEVSDAMYAVAERIIARNGLPQGTPITLFGEWCGEGIQAGCGVHKLPKHFVLFAALQDSGTYLDIDINPIPPALQALGQLYTAVGLSGVYSILAAPTWELEVDLTSLASVQEAAAKATILTEEVEKKCPWAALFGVDGIGEGIVWSPIGEYAGRGDLLWKSKGDKHKVVSSKEKVQVDPEVLSSVEEFLNYALPEARLQQGISSLLEKGISVEMKAMPHYLKWVLDDVQRECRVELEANALDWKVVQRHLSVKARDFFIQYTKDH